MKIIKKETIIFLLGLLLLAGWFYWFQVRPTNIKQEELEKQINILQKQVELQGRNDSQNTDELKNNIRDLEYEIENSKEETQQYLEDERSSESNCERFGGEYQGNGLCAYY